MTLSLHELEQKLADLMSEIYIHIEAVGNLQKEIEETKEQIKNKKRKKK
jgi:uncharacterized small protein (DUF1192 family)